MGTLTKKEKEIVLKAAKILEDGSPDFCCIALANAEKNPYWYKSSALTKKFLEFYGLKRSQQFEQTLPTDDADHGLMFKESLHEARILALITFAEVG